MTAAVRPMAFPAYWLRSLVVPTCARQWPTAIVAAWWGSRADARLTGMVNAARNTRAEVWLGWLLPPLAWRELAPLVLADLQRTHADGLVLNPEREWLGASNEEAAAFVEWFTSRGVRVWVNSYGTPPRSFPLRGFATGAEGGQAQTYDNQNEYRAAYLAESLALYEAAGFRRAVGSVGLWQNLPGTQNDRNKTGAELHRHLGQRPRDSVVWGPARWTRTACHHLAQWAGGGRSSSGSLLALLAIAAGFWAAARGA